MLGFTVLKASELLGVAMDCNLDTGASPGGQNPATNSATINAWAAGATAANPRKLILDGGLLCNGLQILAGNFAIEGYGWETGIYIAPGANACGIITAPMSGDGGTPPTPNTNLVFRNFRINCNRGNGSNGNSTSGDPKVLAGGQGYWGLGLDIKNADNVVLEGVFIYDAPAYAVRFGNCHKFVVRDCRIEAPSHTPNTDGVHINGACSSGVIDGLTGYTWDDFIALNAPEGYGGDIVDIKISNVVHEQGPTFCRIYASQTDGSGRAIRGVTITNFTSNATWYGFMLGGSSGSGSADGIRDVHVSNGTHTGQHMFWVSNSIGVLKASNVTWMNNNGSTSAWVTFEGSGNSVVSHCELTACSTFLQAGYNGATQVAQGAGKLGALILNGFSVPATDGSGYYLSAPILDNSVTVSRLVIHALDPHNINSGTPLAASFSKVGTVSGAGVAATGWQIPDANMQNGVPYWSATTGKLSTKDAAGTVQALY